MKRLGEGLDQSTDANLIDHLGELAGAGRADEVHSLRIGLDNGLRLGEVGFVAADHDRKGTVLGAGLAAGDRRVEESRAALAGFRIKLASDGGGSRGVVDGDCPGLQALEHSVWSQRDGAQVLVVADAGENEIRLGRSFRRCAYLAATELRDPSLRFRTRAIVNGYIVAASGEMAGHGKAHHAKADKGDFAHANILEQ